MRHRSFLLSFLLSFLHCSGLCRLTLGGVLVIACLTATRVHAQAQCSEFARTDLERLYCEINARAPGIVPGTLGEFRKNPPGTQRLLLQRPAARLGLTLPEAPPAARPSEKPEGKSPPPAASAQAGSSENKKPSAPTARTSPEKAAPSTVGLENCRLQARSIVCGTHTYQRLTNQSNRHLAEDALGPDNRLELGPVSAPQEEYLARSYREYLDRMVSIGLAGVTLSYTKFHHFYTEAERTGTSFAGRMAGMFDYLKKDKQSLAVDSRSDKTGPASLASCYRLEDDYIVCDDVSSNWIYRAQ